MFDDESEPQTFAETIARLQLYQIMRRHCIKSQSRCDRSTESLIAGRLGYSTDLSEKDGKAIWKKAQQQRKAAEANGKAIKQGLPPPFELLGAVRRLRDIIVLSGASREHFDDYRDKKVEKQMVALAKKLPAWEWAQGIAGFGALGLAIIVGETGDLSRPYIDEDGAEIGYATEYRLWKRLGLAVLDGERQRRKTNVDEALKHGYSPKRRAEIWAIADSMFKHQWCGEDAAYRAAIAAHPEAAALYDKAALAKLKGDDLKAIAAPFGIVAKAHAKGRYGEVYAIAKEKALAKGWTPAHADNHARRIMSKKLVKDLWVQWHQLTPRHDAECVARSPVEAKTRVHQNMDASGVLP